MKAVRIGNPVTRKRIKILTTMLIDSSKQNATTSEVTQANPSAPQSAAGTDALPGCEGHGGAQIMKENAKRYAEIYRQCTDDPVKFWGDAAKSIDWIKPAERVFNPEEGI